MTLFMLTSRIRRAEETMEIVSNQIWDKKWKDPITKRYLSYENHPENFQKMWTKMQWQKEKTENDIVISFLNWSSERGITVSLLAKPYIEKLNIIFERTIRKNIQISIISFRHWNKDSNWNLSELWKEQAKSLWNKLKNEIDNNGDTFLICTHNVINESIIRCLITKDNLPKEREKPLDFTETVKYTFHPKWKDNSPYLEIERRGKKRSITYEKFKKLTENLKI